MILLKDDSSSDAIAEVVGGGDDLAIVDIYFLLNMTIYFVCRRYAINLEANLTENVFFFIYNINNHKKIIVILSCSLVFFVYIKLCKYIHIDELFLD